ncbi:hypothetical protein OIY81_3639 [Cryptosporidium canis]|nr:hypothetical protein OIY81_3639 [Cryptosporidium canis]
MEIQIEEVGVVDSERPGQSVSSGQTDQAGIVAITGDLVVVVLNGDPVAEYVDGVDIIRQVVHLEHVQQGREFKPSSPGPVVHVGLGDLGLGLSRMRPPSCSHCRRSRCDSPGTGSRSVLSDLVHPVAGGVLDLNQAIMVAVHQEESQSAPAYQELQIHIVVGKRLIGERRRVLLPTPPVVHQHEALVDEDRHHSVLVAPQVESQPVLAPKVSDLVVAVTVIVQSELHRDHAPQTDMRDHQGVKAPARHEDLRQTAHLLLHLVPGGRRRRRCRRRKPRGRPLHVGQVPNTEIPSVRLETLTPILILTPTCLRPGPEDHPVEPPSRGRQRNQKLRIRVHRDLVEVVVLVQGQPKSKETPGIG